MRILLAEDDQNIATIARLCLEHIGHHQVVHAADGERALEIALSENFDVLLLDEMMPKLNGLTVCAEYRKLKLQPHTPVIFLSAKSQQRDVLEFERMGLGLISKPFDPKMLCTQIDLMLKGAA